MKTRFFPSKGAALFAAAAVLLSSLSGCATNPVTGKQDFVMMSESQEIEMGKKYAREVIPKEYSVYKDPELNAYVSRIGKKLAGKSHRTNLVYHFTVLDSPEVNAFALPGGYIYITRGIIAYMQNEAQLAGVLAHEIGHVTARHTVRQQSASQALSILETIAIVGTGVNVPGGALDLVNAGLISGYGRKHELEADRLGSEYLARAGYDPEEMLGVIGILKDQEAFEIRKAKAEGRQPRTYHGLFASHPKNDARLKEVIAAAEKFRQPATANPDPEAFLARLDGLVFGHSEDQGVIRGNRFYHKSLDFTVAFPKGWRFENQTDRLIAISPRNDLILQLMLDDRNLQGGPDDFLRRNFSQVSQIERRSSGSASAIARLRSSAGTGTGRVGVVFLGDKAFVLAGLGKKGLPPKKLFDQTLDSIRRLRGDERQLTAAHRIRIVRARPGDTFARLAQESPLGTYAEDQLRLLNGKYPKGEPVPGQLIKIVR